MNTCERCKFFSGGECRRFPPQGVGIIAVRTSVVSQQTEPKPVFAFPAVQPQQWCGEWQVKMQLAS